jgi:GT2 family glycosyltransferase
MTMGDEMDLSIPDLSIIVVNWNTQELLRECLKSIEAHGCGAETIVVDNGSEDGSMGMVENEFSWVRLLKNVDNIGFARANNQGIETSKGMYVLLLNSDARLTEGALEEMVKCMEGSPQVGICGPMLVYPDGSEQESFGMLPTLWGELGRLFGVKSSQYEGRPVRGEIALLNGVSEKSKLGIQTEVVSGASMLVRRKTLETIGPLDERFFMFNEEVDLCKRAREGGWKVAYVPGAVVVHVGGGSTGLTAGRVLRLYGGKKKYFEKHKGHLQACALWWAMRISTWLKVLVYTTQQKGDRVNLWREVGRGMGELK